MGELVTRRIQVRRVRRPEGPRLVFHILTVREGKASVAIASNESLGKAHMFVRTSAEVLRFGVARRAGRHVCCRDQRQPAVAGLVPRRGGRLTSLADRRAGRLFEADAGGGGATTISATRELQMPPSQFSCASRRCRSAFLHCCHILVPFPFAVCLFARLALRCLLRAMDRCANSDHGPRLPHPLRMPASCRVPAGGT